MTNEWSGMGGPTSLCGWMDYSYSQWAIANSGGRFRCDGDGEGQTKTCDVHIYRGGRRETNNNQVTGLPLFLTFALI